jgi:hypothetical protein
MEDYHVDRADESVQLSSVRNRESEESGTSLCDLAFLESDSSSDESVDPADESVQCIFVKNREVDLKTSFCNLEFLGSDPFSNTTALDDSVVSSSNNASNVAACNTVYVSCNTSLTSSIATVEVEEYRYSDTKKGIELVELRYPPLLNKDYVDSDTDVGLHEAECSYSDKRNSFKRNSVEWRGDSMDSELLHEELKSRENKSPGPITEITKTIYLRRLPRLPIKAKEEQQREEQQKQPEKVYSKELQTFLDHYPGLIDDRKTAKDLDRELVEYFNSLGPDTPLRARLREGNKPKLLTYFEKFNSEMFFSPLFWVTRHNRSCEKIL